jgi:glycosyltransferase involved in cell wall biosynthesis
MTKPFQTDGKFLRRGNERFLVRGVTYGTFASRADSTLFPSRERIKSDFVSMSEAGFNTVRTYTEPPDDLLDLASDWGLALLAGVHWNDWRYLVGGSRRQWRAVERDAVRAVRQSAEHLAGNPNVLALCVGNEIPTDVVRWVGTERVARLLGRLADTVRETDPDRLVTYANYPSTEYLPLDPFDFLTFNIFLERESDLRSYLTRLHNLAGSRPLVIGEIGSHVPPDRPARASNERIQARKLDRQLFMAAERGVAGTCVFSWTDEWNVGGMDVEGWQFGLTRRDRSPRPALAVAAEWNHKTVADLRPDRGWPSMSVVVCAYNAAETLDECLRHACALDYEPLEVIVVDDGSTDGTPDIVRRHPLARLVQVPHGGLSNARNAGYESAQNEIVAYLDADAYPSPEWPYYMSLGFDSRLVGGVGGPNVPPGEDPLGAHVVARCPGGPVHVLLSDDRAEHVPGCNMAFWRDILIDRAGFEPVYETAGDDVDFCWRVLDSGWQIGFHPAALVWHHRRPTARAYLRQQRAYGRAEALVAARHPERFTGIGSARWRGRLYGVGATRLAGSRIYRGAFGAAAYQSVYGRSSTAYDLTQQLGVPVAAAAVATAPLGLATPSLSIPALLGLVLLIVLALTGAVRADAVGATRAARLAFRLRVGFLSSLQPLARAWGRIRHSAAAQRQAPAPPVPVAAVRAGRNVLMLSSSGSRLETARVVMDSLRRSGLPVRMSTEWEDHDGEVLGSLAVGGQVVTMEWAPASVQMRVRRRLRPQILCLVGATLIVGLAHPAWVAAPLVLTVAELLRGFWRTGPALRRAVLSACPQP